MALEEKRPITTWVKRSTLEAAKAAYPGVPTTRLVNWGLERLAVPTNVAPPQPQPSGEQK